MRQCGFRLCEQTDRQTDRHMHHNTSHPSWGRSNYFVQHVFKVRNVGKTTYARIYVRLKNNVLIMYTESRAIWL